MKRSNLQKEWVNVDPALVVNLDILFVGYIISVLKNKNIYSYEIG
jgi:hypothetical protein